MTVGANPDRVSLFVTCVGELVEPEVPVAAVRVLRASGCTVEVPAGQTCCGQPAWNSGFTIDAARVAAASLVALEADPEATVVVPAGSCATMIRLYWPQLFELAGDLDASARARAVAARTVEFTEYLSGRQLPDCEVDPVKVACHQSCHMLRELHIEDEPYEAIDRVAGCEVVPWEASDRCCGFGGTFSVKLPEASAAMADDKLDELPDGVSLIVGADASCLLQLRTRARARGLAIDTVHVARLLEDGLAGGSEPGAGERP